MLKQKWHTNADLWSVTKGSHYPKPILRCPCCLTVFDQESSRKAHIEKVHLEQLKGSSLRKLQFACMNMDGPGVRNVSQQKIDFHFPPSDQPPNFTQRMASFLADIHHRIAADTERPLRVLSVYKADLRKVTR